VRAYSYHSSLLTLSLNLPSRTSSAPFLRRLSLFLVWVASFGHVAWARAESTPDWVQTGQSRAYPAGRYMVGVGSAGTLDAARDIARGELAKQFSVRVEIMFENEQVAQTSQMNSGLFMMDSDRSRALVRSQSDQTLQGIQIAQTYVQKDGSLTYALAVLERRRAEGQLVERIADLDQAVEAQSGTSASEHTDKIARLRALVRVAALLRERDVLNSQLTVVNPGLRARPTLVSAAKIGDAIREILPSIKVFIDSAEVLPTDIRSGAEEAVSKIGFAVTKDKPKADFLLHVELGMHLTDRLLESGFIYADGVLTTQLESRIGDQPSTTGRQVAKDGGRTEAEAIRKAQRRLRDKLVIEVRREIDAYLAPSP